MKFSQVAWRSVASTALRAYRQADTSAWASQMAYNFVFALFPFALFVAALGDVVDQVLGRPTLFPPLSATLTSVLGPAVGAALQEVLRQQRGGGLALRALLALGFAANGVGTVMRPCNQA